MSDRLKLDKDAMEKSQQFQAIAAEILKNDIGGDAVIVIGIENPDLHDAGLDGLAFLSGDLMIGSAARTDIAAIYAEYVRHILTEAATSDQGSTAIMSWGQLDETT
jgi:hypothetical protein